jgi:PPM family protein phosphatase
MIFHVASRQKSYREATEDRSLVLEVAPNALLLGVADGVGGRPGGGEAAQLAIETLEAEESALSQNSARVWRGFFVALNDALTVHPEAGQTTLVALLLTHKKIMGASIGDSEAWWITSDGHFAITEAQTRKPYLGSGAAEPIVFELKITTPGTLLLASDGLFKYADQAAILEGIRTAETVDIAADALVKLASGVSGRFYDDLSLIVVRVEVGEVGTMTSWTHFLRRFKAG